MKHKIQGSVFVIAITIVAVAFTLHELPVAAQKKVDFNREVRPIFSDTCFACHGPDDKQRMAKLRFETKEGAPRG